MIIEKRQDEILDILRRKPDATVADLSRMLYVSEPTIRRDLTVLEGRGILRKKHGGALLTGAADGEIPFSLREQERSRVKAALGKRAAALVQDGMVVMLDGSTSAYSMVPFLAPLRDVIVVTSGARTAVALAEQNVRVYSTGGEMILHSFSYVGRQAEEFVRTFHADVCFFSCRGLREDGLMTDRAVEEVNLRRVMLEQSRRRVLLCDSDKLGKTCFYTLGNTNELDDVICDVPLPEGIKTRA